MVLSVTNLTGFGGSAPFNGTMLEAIQLANATTSLNFVLDAGDSASYSGTGQTWTDTSGSSNSMFRGFTSSGSSDDPTFNGTAGDKSSATYWSFDGLDVFSQSAAHTYANGWHKDNGAFTLIYVFYALATKANRSVLWANRNTNASEDGIMFSVTTAKAVQIISNAGVSGSQSLVSAATAAGGKFQFFAGAYDEASLTYEMRIDSTAETGAVLSSSNTTNPARNIAFGYDYAASPAYIENGERLICCAGWSRKLTSAELTSIYGSLKDRLGLS